MVKSGLSLSKPRIRKNEIIDLGSSGYYLIVFSYLRAPEVFFYLWTDYRRMGC